jgi:hypothetical protein
VFRDRLAAFQQALEAGDAPRLLAWWSAARARRILFNPPRGRDEPGLEET